MWITREYLRANPNHVFVFGDNLLGIGKGGAALLRDEPNTYGFITKKAPNNRESSFYKPEEYKSVFVTELHRLVQEALKHPERTYLVSMLGSKLANRYRIWEEVILPALSETVLPVNIQLLFSKDTTNENTQT